MNRARLTSIMLLSLLVLVGRTAGADGPTWTMPYNSLGVSSTGTAFDVTNAGGRAAEFSAGPDAGVYAVSQMSDGIFGYSYALGPAVTAGLVGSGRLRGVVGRSRSIGIYGEGGLGVYGTATAQGIGLYGVGYPNGTGVYGASDTGAGVHGYSSTGYAGKFVGDVNVVGTLTKGGGGFKIDHPLDPTNKFLSHSFVESPEMKTVYDGVAALDALGQAVVELPAWFEALNRDFRYQLTPIGSPAPDLHIAQEIAENSFRIAGGPAGLRVSWQITGIRRDAYAEQHRVPVEEEKSADDRGKYLHPVEHGQPERLGIFHGEIEAAEILRMEVSKSSEEFQRRYPLDNGTGSR